MSAATDDAARPGSVPLVEVLIVGDLDQAVLPRVQATLDDSFALRPERIVVDLSACPLVDAAGIGLLLEAHRRAWRSDGRLLLRAVPPDVLRILRIARVEQVFEYVT
jgi:anti-anti-sigma factor